MDIQETVCPCCGDLLPNIGGMKVWCIKPVIGRKKSEKFSFFSISNLMSDSESSDWSSPFSSQTSSPSMPFNFTGDKFSLRQKKVSILE
jgi:hypothetical protein